MFSAVADGVSSSSIARTLNMRGIRTMFGKRFESTAIRRTVENPCYIGMIVGGRKSRGKFRAINDDGTVVCENARSVKRSADVQQRCRRTSKALSNAWLRYGQRSNVAP